MEQERRPGVPPETDEERFARIWRRVMPQDRPDCPFTLYEEPPTSAAIPAFAPIPARNQAPVQEQEQEQERRLMPNTGDQPTAAARQTFAPVPSAPLPAPVRAEMATPAPEEMGSAVGVFLQARVAVELTAARTYRNMAMRVGGTASQALTTIATDKTRHAKRLSVAYFLLSGVRLQSSPSPGETRDPLMGALRRCYLDEQGSESAYRTAAVNAADAPLKELFQELAASSALHASRLRGVLERI
ncbi:putative Rubrerythrin [uncultured Eubacteriales bacterium]|uniref:Putative Rubrerythrin n=1 Tax=uncultured Eubacteriales bacterium TaxID=172733 RepID=A0A212KIM1_9FIRM|nr:putative Rubrerythrin [uncultured Eubacteriales bacterium]